MYHDILISFIFQVILHCFLKSTEIPKGLSQYTQISTTCYGEDFFDSRTMLENKVINRFLFCKILNGCFNIRLYFKLATDCLLFEICKNFLLVTICDFILMTDNNEMTMTLLHKIVEKAQKFFHRYFTTLNIIKD